MTVILLTCSYDGREFVRVGYYVNNEYDSPELNDDPLQPLSVFAKNLIDEKGDDTPVAWLHRDERYTEKLATRDVSVADLIGDADPIKAATLKLPSSRAPAA